MYVVFPILFHSNKNKIKMFFFSFWSEMYIIDFSQSFFNCHFYCTRHILRGSKLREKYSFEEAYSPGGIFFHVSMKRDSPQTKIVPIYVCASIFIAFKNNCVYPSVQILVNNNWRDGPARKILFKKVQIA